LYSSPLFRFSRLKADDIPEPEFTTPDHIPLTTHTDAFGVDPVPISWSHPNPSVRGPVICTVRHNAQRNAIGAHSGSYCIYTGLAVAAGMLNMRIGGVALALAINLCSIDLSKNFTTVYVFSTSLFERKIESRLRPEFEIDIPGFQDWTLSIVV
jgi:hypothetical protein